MNIKEINFSIPRSWNELPTRQLEKIMQLGMQRDILASSNPYKADSEYKLKVLLLLLGLSEKPKSVTDSDGNTIFLFRKRNLGLFKKRTPLTANQLVSFLENNLKWLDKPFQRIRAPYDFIRVKGKKFKCPSNKLTSLTYQQYTMAQNILNAYLNTQKNIDFLTQRHSDKKSINFQYKKIKQLRCLFLSCLFCPSQLEKEIIRDGRKFKTNRISWNFDPAQIEFNASKFSRSHKRLFPVMLNFFISTQQYFANIFPYLFVERKQDDKKTDVVLREIETMTAIMKYQGFADYQTIYDSNTVHVLKILDNMARESEEIKKQMAKTKK